ncbi:MAG: AAA family ATPase [bacterium]
MKIPRFYQELNKYLKPNKVLVIYGPRQVGKTTLLQDFLSQSQFKYKLESGDNIQVRHILGSQDTNLIREFTEGYELLVPCPIKEV